MRQDLKTEKDGNHKYNIDYGSGISYYKHKRQNVKTTMEITPEAGQYISAVLQTLSVVFAIIVLHKTLFKNEDKDDDM